MTSNKKRVAFIFLLFLLSYNYVSNKFLEKESFSEEDVITTITSDDESALRDALLILWKFGGIIYIDTPVLI